MKVKFWATLNRFLPHFLISLTLTEEPRERRGGGRTLVHGLNVSACRIRDWRKKSQKNNPTLLSYDRLAVLHTSQIDTQGRDTTRTLQR